MSRPLGKLLTDWSPGQRPGTMRTRARRPPFPHPKSGGDTEELRMRACAGVRRCQRGGSSRLSQPTDIQTKIRDPPCGSGKVSAPFSLKAHRVRLNRRQHLRLSFRRLQLIGSGADGWISSNFAHSFWDGYRELYPVLNVC